MNWHSCYRKGRIVLLWVLFGYLWVRVLELTSVREAGGAVAMLGAAVAFQLALTLVWIRHNRRRPPAGERRRRSPAITGDFSRDVLGRPVVLAEDSGWFDRELRISIAGGRKIYRAAGAPRI